MANRRSQDGVRPDVARRRARWPLVAASMALGLAGCDCSPPRAKPWRHEPEPARVADTQPRSAALDLDPEHRPRADRDRVLRVHVDAEPRALNPLTAPSVWSRRIALGPVFETLLRYEPPESGAGTGPGRYAPSLARSWRIMPGGREIRFELEPGVRFHDGRPMTSVDVQFTLDAVRDPRRNIDHLRRMLAQVAAVELITPREVRLVLYEPDAFVLRALAEIPILPMHVYGGDLAAGGRIVGTGPWQLASWKNRAVRLTAWGGYWGQAPAIPELEFVVEPDAARVLTDAKRGGYDVIPALIPAHWPEQASAPGIASTFLPLELRPPRLRYVAMHCRQAPTDDPRVREAIARLIDRRRLAREVHDGLARPAAGPVWPGGPGDGPSPAAPAYDPVEATRLLAEAGWIDADKDGVRERGGQRLHVVALLLEPPAATAGGPRPVTERAAIVESLRRAGFSVEVRAGTEAVVMNRVRAGEFGIALLELAQPVDTSLAPLLGTGGALDVGRCATPALDRALAAMAAAWEPAARVPLAGELASLVARTWPIAGVVAPAPQGLVHRRVRGVVVWDGWFDLRRLALDGEQPAP